MSPETEAITAIGVRHTVIRIVRRRRASGTPSPDGPGTSSGSTLTGPGWFERMDSSSVRAPPLPGPNTNDAERDLLQWHTIMRMTQEDGELDSLVRKRIRALRVAQGWSLEELAARAKVSQSTLSRIENGRRRLALDQLVTLARALDTSLDQLVETASDDIVSNPMIDGAHGQMRWPIKAEPGMTVIRQRMTDPPPDNPARLRAHPGREWLVVLSGTAILLLGNRRLRIETNQAAEFPTMLPHAIGAEGGPCELLGIFDRDARRGHQRGEGVEEARRSS